MSQSWVKHMPDLYPNGRLWQNNGASDDAGNFTINTSVLHVDRWSHWWAASKWGQFSQMGLILTLVVSELLSL
jgi:hypothetical protein